MPIKLLGIHFTIESLTCKNKTHNMLIPLCFKHFHQLTRKCCLIAATVGVIIFFFAQRVDGLTCLIVWEICVGSKDNGGVFKNVPNGFISKKCKVNTQELEGIKRKFDQII